MGPPPTDFKILCVCTGNVCRSPVAERLLARDLAPLGISVTSAGTEAPRGAQIAPQMNELLRSRGIDASDHRARWLTEQDVLQADLVLGMAKEHRSQAVQLAPVALLRSFTLTDLATIAQHIPARELDRAAPSTMPIERLRALVRLAPRYRQFTGVEDIDDPIGLDEATYARVFAEIESAVAVIVAVVTASDGIGQPA